jgi:hypothetical protein
VRPRNRRKDETLFLASVVFVCFPSEFSGTVFAQSAGTSNDQRCSIGEVSTKEHLFGVTVRTADFVQERPSVDEENRFGLPRLGSKYAKPAPTYPRKKVTVYLFIPDSADPVPGALFTHSALHSFDGTTSLLPFARALAHSGVATLMLDRTLETIPYPEQFDSSVVDCAYEWFKSEVRLEPRVVAGGIFHVEQHLARMGADFTGFNFAMRTPEQPGRNFFMTSTDGQLMLGNSLLRYLNNRNRGNEKKLKMLDSEWLKIETVPDEKQIAASN